MYRLFFLLILVIFFSCKEDYSNNTSDLSSFHLAEGFEIELFASEPLIGDPVDMEIDENGDVYVVEMHGYPLDVKGSGVIKKLIDTNSDGYPDESLVFAEGLILPTSIMRWKKGFMVTDAPDVLYLEDTDGDGKADIKEVILTGFARSNPQHNLNSPVYGLDNWVYLAHEGDVHTVMFDSIFEDQGKNIRFPNKPDANSLPQNALGKSVRFKPDQGQLEVLSSRTQFGHDFDDFGRLFMATNSQHIYQEIFPYEYVNRKPDLGVFMPVAYIPEHGNNAEVFPVTKNAEHQLLTDIGVFTSACGLTIYNGGAFPQAYQGVSFVAEPVHNLVHVDKLSPNGVPFKAQRMFQQEEFLASEDPLFRPVNFYVGPDGALYVLDYYRKIIEHPEWMSEEVISSGDLYKGTNQGRIYRISPKGAKKPDFMGKKLLDNTNIEQLIENLSSDNKWFRINAQRLLVENKSAKATALLRKKIANTDDSLGSLHALWVLEGTNQLKEADIIQALESTSPGVLENAIKLSEEFINNPEIVESLVQMAHKDLPLRVHFQLLLSLGNYGSQKAIDAVNYLLSLYPDDDWMVTAGMSSPYFDEESWLKSLMDSKNLNVDFLTRLSYLLTMENKIEVLQGILLESIKVKNEQISIPIIKGITRGWRERDENPEINREELPIIQGFLFSEGEASKVWRDFIKTIKVPLKKSQKHFINILENENNDALKRASAISLILNHGDPGEKVKSYLDPRQPLPVQVASVEWLSEYADSDDSFNEYLMVNWEKLSSPVRNRAVDLMIGSEERSKLLLTAIESEKIDKSIVGWRRSVRLMNSKDEDIKERARALFDGSDADGENILANYGDINTSSGDATMGKTVFMNYCSTCHKIGDALGTDYGPDLLSIKNQAKSAILKHVLQPGLSLADGYELWDINLKDESQMQGIISNEDEKTMTLLVAPGNEVRINREDIESIKVLDTSGMPNGLGNSIGKKDMEDLLEFIKEYRRE